MKDKNGLTSFGYFARYLRNKYEQTGDCMAINLGISRNFLTQIELGYRPAPLYIVRNLVQTYYLSEEEIDKLINALGRTNKEVKQINLANVPTELKDKIMQNVCKTIIEEEIKRFK